MLRLGSSAAIAGWGVHVGHMSWHCISPLCSIVDSRCCAECGVRFVESAMLQASQCWIGEAELMCNAKGCLSDQLWQPTHSPNLTRAWQACSREQAIHTYTSQPGPARVHRVACSKPLTVMDHYGSRTPLPHTCAYLQRQRPYLSTTRAPECTTAQPTHITHIRIYEICINIIRIANMMSEI
jgi:hypothetical protein